MIHVGELAVVNGALKVMTHASTISPRKRPTAARWMPVLLSVFAMMGGGSAAWAAAATTTTLTVTPANPASGDVISLKAVVSSTSTVGGGNVTFTDTYNGVSEPLGTVPVQSASGIAGTALLATEVGGVGVHQFVATYNGTKVFSSSSSTAQSTTFIGPYRSATALAGSGTGPYTFTGTVSAFGPTAPTGSVTFTNTTSNVTLGTASLTPGTLQTGFTPFTLYPISNLNDGNTGNTNQPAIGDFNGDGRPDYAIPSNTVQSRSFWARAMGPLASAPRLRRPRRLNRRR